MKRLIILSSLKGKYDVTASSRLAYLSIKTGNRRKQLALSKDKILSAPQKYLLIYESDMKSLLTLAKKANNRFLSEFGSSL